ncbi:MAG: AbrB/MazE/SpoVT family DNA-binding domain-containing protein [Nitrospirae bacterium]|nr:AbrB/MazE/SpoVT family DNA-binding domain-containing protein [Nitrospirota bacterium]MBF0590898.1 AbrB/MazE/SpoVT family DNA-binding domain-containing protein [Nitrospirota bacterium]
MSIPVKITSKGQVTIPKKIRDILKTDFSLSSLLY